ncbi:unnamed protein product [Cyclocybe aegerita]|uniref:Uncharacterized protein n=1 Tax=Cyclocybe aegerita TaxID=1973307 RepID=A0A8S0WAR9_CYCAE|nr:unnamed protein product [Cyclocybe aegerita]
MGPPPIRSSTSISDVDVSASQRPLDTTSFDETFSEGSRLEASSHARSPTLSLSRRRLEAADGKDRKVEASAHPTHPTAFPSSLHSTFISQIASPAALTNAVALDWHIWC